MRKLYIAPEIGKGDSNHIFMSDITQILIYGFWKTRNG